MASATRLPLKSIGFAILIIGSAGASRTNLRNLLTRTFTGPGKYSRIAAALLLLLNLKSLPFVWHVSAIRRGPFLCASTNKKCFTVPRVQCDIQTLSLQFAKHTPSSRSLEYLPSRHYHVPPLTMGMRLQHAQIELHILLRSRHHSLSSCLRVVPTWDPQVEPQ